MIPVISQQKWRRWCESKQLPVATADFALDTCYYGLSMRTRPGTLLLNESGVIHYSYSVWDTPFALFEPSICVSIPLRTIGEVMGLKLGIFTRVLHGFPHSAFRIMTTERSAHDFVLQRNGQEFVDALLLRGLRVQPDGAE